MHAGDGQRDVTDSEAATFGRARKGFRYLLD